MTEGRSTGFPKIYQAINRNDSPLPIFETDERNTHFLATLPIHRAFIDEKAYLSSIGKKIDEGNNEDFIKNFIKDFIKEIDVQLTEREYIILNIIAEDKSVTLEKISEKLSKKKTVTTRTIASDIAHLKKIGILTREGGRKDGHWAIRYPKAE